MTKKSVLVLLLLFLVSVSGYSQLSQAIGFFAYNKCGSGQSVSWRGNCHTGDNPGGGYHDAGDHVKFNLPMAFTAAMISWADYEYGASVDTPVSEILSYLTACGTSGSIKYQVGDGGADHGYWGSPEQQSGFRPTASSSQVSCVQAGSAAAFAIAECAGLNGGSISKAKSLLSAAESAMSDAGYTAAGGFYNSWSGFWDELAWASIWIYLATDDSFYLEKAESYVDDMQTDFKWTHCWDDNGYGVYLKLAQITQKEKYITQLETWLDWWCPGGGINYTSGGLPWLDSWGCLRYASATAFCAKLWADTPFCTPEKRTKYRQLHDRILSYIKGNNPRNASYIIGYGSNYPRNPHHRAACPSKINGDCSHVLTGALVGGPGNDDRYVDDLNQYIYTEVALDYNACLIAGLAADQHNNPKSASYKPTDPPTPTPTPGPTAPPGSGNGLKGEYYSGRNFDTLRLTRTDPIIDFNWGGGAPQGTSLPADDFTIRWTGQIEPVYTDTYTFYETSDDGCRVIIDNQNVINQWSDGAAEEFTGTISLTAGRKYEIRVEFYENWGEASIQLAWSSMYQTKQIVPRDRLYTGGEMPTPTPTGTPGGIPGDVNNDRVINIIDALLVAQYYIDLNPPNFHSEYADVDCNGTINIVDALRIAQYFVGLINQFC